MDIRPATIEAFRLVGEDLREMKQRVIPPRCHQGREIYIYIYIIPVLSRETVVCC